MNEAIQKNNHIGLKVTETIGLALSNIFGKASMERKFNKNNSLIWALKCEFDTARLTCQIKFRTENQDRPAQLSVTSNEQKRAKYWLDTHIQHDKTYEFGHNSGIGITNSEHFLETVIDTIASHSSHRIHPHILRKEIQNVQAYMPEQIIE